MINTMNRKGQLGNQLMIFIYLALLTMIAVGIVVGTLIFFGPGYDSRQADSDILNNRVVNCLMQNDFTKVKADIYGVCGFNKIGLNETLYKINVCDGSCGEQLGIISVGGNFAVCKLTGKGVDYPKCTITNIIKDGKSYEVMTASNQFPRSIQ